MRLYPTRATFHVALAGTAMMTAGVAIHRAAPAAFGGAIILAIAFGKALSFVGSTRLRRAGFEMVWALSHRVIKLARGSQIVVQVELRNRGKDPVRVVGLRAVASSFLDVRLTPTELDLPEGTSVMIDVAIQARRVGRWGIHGLALELRGMPGGGEGLYEVPLVFSNPFGVEVHPVPLAALLGSARGGRSGRVAPSGRSARRMGEGDELRELREHVIGDPFKRIAWRASARRGRLMVREMERQEQDVVWLLLDASVEGWAGEPGRAPLDRAVDELAAVAIRHLTRGDRVGLIVYASRLRSWIAPDRGPPQAARIAAALASCASMIDIDRCALDEYEVAQRVAEHIRPLDPQSASHLTRKDIDRLAGRAERIRERAPFAARVPHALSARDRTLRHYLACFGVEVAPRTEGERDHADIELARVLGKLYDERPRPSIVAVWANAPLATSPTAHAIRRLRARKTEVRWTLPALEASVGSPDKIARGAAVQASVDEAVRIRARVAAARALAALRALGIRPEKIRFSPPKLALPEAREEDGP
jgi:uncharacterized protein (DUF58 family)